jgi:predicted kinase
MREPFLDYMDRELKPGTLLIACGLPASYKTETTEEVARLKGYPILRTDLIRLEVLKGQDIFDEKVAGDMDKRKMVYDEMFRRAEEAVTTGDGVILDATFVIRDLRFRAADIAARNGKTLVILQTQCPEEVSLERISRRTKEDYESNALTPAAYHANKGKFQSVDLDKMKEAYHDLHVIHYVVDTTEDPPIDWYVISRDARE